MKKVFLLAILATVSVALLSSCSKLKSKGNLYVMEVKLKNGAGVEQDASFAIEKKIIDENKVSEETIVKMIEDASADCQYTLKNTYSYELLPSTERTGFIMTRSEGGYSMTFDYIGQNSFGTKSKESGLIEFDKSGKIVTSPLASN